MIDQKKWGSAAGLALMTILFGVGLIVALPIAILSAITSGIAMGLVQVAVWPLMRCKDYVEWGTKHLTAWQERLFKPAVLPMSPPRSGGGDVLNGGILMRLVDQERVFPSDPTPPASGGRTLH